MEKFETKTLHRTFDQIYFGFLEAPGSAPVTTTGTVRMNKEFGAGYTYALIVEDAKVVVK